MTDGGRTRVCATWRMCVSMFDRVRSRLLEHRAVADAIFAFRPRPPACGPIIHQHGFITLQLSLYIIAGMAVALLLSWGGLYVQTQRLKATKAEYAGFVADVKAKGKEAEKAAKESERKAKQNKERSDAENKRLRTANESLNRSLREQRAGSSLLSTTGAGTFLPNLACFDRAYLERTLSGFVEGTAKLIEEGDAARADLDSARTWNQGR